MSDSVPTKTAITAGVSLAMAGLAVGLAGPKLVQNIIGKMKPGGKFTGVSEARCDKVWQGTRFPICRFLPICVVFAS